MLLKIKGKLILETLENEVYQNDLLQCIHTVNKVSTITWCSLPSSPIYLIPLLLPKLFNDIIHPGQISSCFQILSSSLHSIFILSHILELILLFNQITPSKRLNS